jgi:hypothetical protein
MGIAFSTVDRALDPHIIVAVSGLIAIEKLIRSGKLAPLPINRMGSEVHRGAQSSTSASTI